MLRILFLLGILGPGLIAAVYSRYAALLLYLWFALFRPQEWVWVDISSLRLSFVLGLLLVIPALVARRFPNVTHPLSIGMLLFLGLALLSQLTAVDPELGWQWVDFTARLFTVCLLLVTLTTSVPHFVGVVAVIAVSFGVHAARAGLVYAVEGGVRYSAGLAGAFEDNNGWALGTAMILPLVVVTAQNLHLLGRGAWTTWTSLALLAAVPLCALSIVGTYSRGGFVATAAAALVFVLLQRRRFVSLTALALVALVGALVAPVEQGYIARLQTIRTYEEIGEDSALGRLHFWRVGVQMGADNPLGVGLRQFESAYDAYDTSHGRFGERRSVHSSHLQVLAELGPMGALLWVALFAYAVRTCFRVRACGCDDSLPEPLRRFFFTTANGLLTSMAAFAVGGAFVALALNDLTWLTFALVAALDRVMQWARAAADVRDAGAEVPLAFRAVSSYAPATLHTARGWR